MYKLDTIDSTQFEILLHQLCHTNNLSNRNNLHQICVFDNSDEPVKIICPTPSMKCNIAFPKFTPQYNSFSPSLQIIWTTNLQSSTMLWITQWCEHIVMTFQKLVWLFKKICCTWFLDVSSLDLNCFDSCLNHSIDIKNDLNNLISWDIDYIQGCTTPIINIMVPRVDTH